MRKVIASSVLFFSLLFIVACEVGVKIHSRPNPIPNVAYSLFSTYETKVLIDPDDPNSELVDAVMLKWLYKLDQHPTHTPVLKHLVSEVEFDEGTETGDYWKWVEWKSQVHYRDDGVVDNTQVVIHKNR